ncbi:hypothetical protein [Streptosporangium roseum]|uniref:hypothetical protein n=1 Tax=Streptosporangium roseum TaxID=2001 RepID=UPI0001A3EB87|nr:hypothetical protein [Streptosporangium roseum]
MQRAVVVAGEQDQVPAAAGSRQGGSADLLVDRGHDQVTVGEQGGDGQVREHPGGQVVFGADELGA